MPSNRVSYKEFSPEERLEKVIKLLALASVRLAEEEKIKEMPRTDDNKNSHAIIRPISA